MTLRINSQQSLTVQSLIVMRKLLSPSMAELVEARVAFDKLRQRPQ